MTTITATDETPRVWIGCLAHYNAGYLIGDWFDAETADEVTLADVHEASGRPYTACEELWCLDHEYLPVRGELSPYQASLWGKRLAEVDEHQRPALRAWVESGSYVAEGDTDLPVLIDFEDRFCGHWGSFREYAEDWADQTGLTAGWPDDAQRYFNWDSWVRDLAYEYSIVDAPADQGYGVFIFRNL